MTIKNAGDIQDAVNDFVTEAEAQGLTPREIQKQLQAAKQQLRERSYQASVSYSGTKGQCSQVESMLRIKCRELGLEVVEVINSDTWFYRESKFFFYGPSSKMQQMREWWIPVMRNLNSFF